MSAKALSKVQAGLYEALIAELRENMAMADNRLECALMGDEICRECVEIARSYLTPTPLAKEGE